MKIYYKSVPFSKEDITLAIESGIDGLIVPKENVVSTSKLSRIEVLADEDFPCQKLEAKEDEENFTQSLLNGKNIILSEPWEIIPVENILARSKNLLVEVENIERAKLAAGILECGVAGIVVLQNSIMSLKKIIEECRQSQGRQELEEAEIIEVSSSGLGHRVCIDTLSIFEEGQGMLVGNSSAFTFLVHAETADNEYVASRPFRVNAGAVHAYIQLANDKTCYLEELKAGDEVLTIKANGESSLAIVGRVKIEVRPMLKIVAKLGDKIGTMFLQNAETIRLTQKNKSISVVDLKAGDKVLCKQDVAGRHFGMRIEENIKEV